MSKVEYLDPKYVLHVQSNRVLSILSRALDLIVLTIPIEAIIAHCFSQQVDQVLGRSWPALAIGKLLNSSTHFYTVLLWTLLGILLIYKQAFSKWQKRGRILIPLAVVLVTCLCVIENALGMIGSDSVSEVTRTQWSQVLNYARQFLQTANLNAERTGIACTPFLFLLLLFFMVRKRIYRPNKHLALLSACIALGALAWFSYYDLEQLLQARNSFAQYENNLQTGTREEMKHFARVKSMPTVFVYIGESSNRDMLYRELEPRIEHSPFQKNVVYFSDVISPHSHTFFSLVRTLSVSIDPEHDQLIDDRHLIRANMISILKQAGIATSWISNKPTYEWIAGLFGREADDMYIQNQTMNAPEEKLKKDSDVLSVALDKLQRRQPSESVIFFHSQAGHSNYCNNIPSASFHPVAAPEASLPFPAVFGNLPLLSRKLHLHDINCYRNAMAYVADNIERTLQQASIIDKPVVVLYFSDHGEDVMDGTGHDSSRPDFRKIEVPMLVYFNDAAKHDYENDFEHAVANRDSRYSITWISDSILGLAGMSYDRRAPFSVFGPLGPVPDRYSTLRTYGGKQYAIAVDHRIPPNRGISTSDIDLYTKRRLIDSLPADQRSKICASQTDSLLKFLDASRVFPCAAIDLVVDSKMQEVYAYPQSRTNNGLTLGALLKMRAKLPPALWLRVQNSHAEEMALLLTYLNQRIPPDRRSSILLEVALTQAENDSLKGVLSGMRSAGYGISYHLDNDMGSNCSKHPERQKCVMLKSFIERLLTNAPYSSLSFDVSAKHFATSIQRPEGVELNALDQSVKSEQDIDHGILQMVRRYQIPYESPFGYD